MSTFLTHPQVLLHVEQKSWQDKETKETKTVKFLYFADPNTTVVSRYTYKNQTDYLIIGALYSLELKFYSINGKSGFTIDDIRLAK